MIVELAPTRPLPSSPAALPPWRDDPVARRLRAIRFRERLFDCCAALLAGLCALLGFASLEMIADRFWEFSNFTRQVSLAAALWACASATAILAARALLRHGNLLRQARDVERVLGFDDDALVTYVDLRRAGSLAESQSQAALVLREHALERLKFVDADQIVDARPVVRWLRALGALALILLGLYLAWGRTFGDGFFRCLAPWRAIAPPRAVQIFEVLPGNGTVVAGEPVRFTVKVRADAPPAEAVLAWRAAGESAEIREALSADQKDSGLRVGVYTRELPGFLRPVIYWVRCGDACSGPFHLAVVERPLVTAVSVRVLPPAYAPFAAARTVAGGHVQAVIGSRIEISATPSQPPRTPKHAADTDTAWLQIANARLPMSVSSGSLTATVPVDKDFEYRVGYLDSNGLSSRESVQYRVKALPDQAPKAILRREDVAEDTPTGQTDIVPLRGEADDDLGIAKMWLRARVTNGVERGQPRLIECPLPAPAEHINRVISLDLQPLALQEGDVLECVLIAEDLKRPGPQKAESAPLRIPIVRGAPRTPSGANASVRAEERQPGGSGDRIERLSDQEKALVEEIARLIKENFDEQTRKKLSELADQQEKLADEMLALLEKQAADQGKETPAPDQSKEGETKDSAGDKGNKAEQAKADPNTGNAPENKASEPKQGLGANGEAKEKPANSSQKNGGGESKKENPGKNSAQNNSAPGQPAVESSAKPKPGQGNQGAPDHRVDEARKAREELADASKKMRDGTADEETARKAKDALDHLFRAGRAMKERDMETVSAAKSDAGAKSIPADGERSKPPDGRARPELAKNGPGSGVLKNTTGELKEDDLGRATEKGRVKVSPEYRKALEEYYKAISQ